MREFLMSSRILMLSAQIILGVALFKTYQRVGLWLIRKARP